MRGVGDASLQIEIIRVRRAIFVFAVKAENATTGRRMIRRQTVGDGRECREEIRDRFQRVIKREGCC